MTDEYETPLSSCPLCKGVSTVFFKNIVCGILNHFYLLFNEQGTLVQGILVQGTFF